VDQRDAVHHDVGAAGLLGQVVGAADHEIRPGIVFAGELDHRRCEVEAAVREARESQADQFGEVAAAASDLEQ
jgi:hypothetical protein